MLFVLSVYKKTRTRRDSRLSHHMKSENHPKRGFQFSIKTLCFLRKLEIHIMGASHMRLIFNLKGSALANPSGALPSNGPLGFYKFPNEIRERKRFFFPIICCPEIL